MSSVSLPSGFSLVDCGPQDAQDALRLTKEILAELEAAGRLGLYNLSIPDEDFLNYYTAGDCALLAIETKDGSRVAYAAGHFREYKTKRFLEPIRKQPGCADAALPEIGYIYFIEVAKEYRGRGFQFALFLALEERLVERGAKYLTGLVSPENEASLRNFRKAGYAEIGRTTLESGYPRLLMAKKAGINPAGSAFSSCPNAADRVE